MSPRRFFALSLLSSLALLTPAHAGWREFDVSAFYRLHTVRAIDGAAYFGDARVGKEGLTASVILKFDGRAWGQAWEGPFKGRFWAINGSRDSLYAVSDGAIVHFDGNRWRDITTPEVGTLKFRFVIPRGRGAYFPDEKGAVFAFDGGGWSRVNLPSKAVTAVWPDEAGGAYVLARRLEFSGSGRMSWATGIELYRFGGDRLEEIPFRLIGNRAQVENEFKRQATRLYGNRELWEERKARVWAEVAIHLTPAYLLLGDGRILALRVEPDTVIDQAEGPDARQRFANVPRTGRGLLITTANEQTLRDAAPYPVMDWVLVSADGVNWRKLTEIYASDGRPSADHVIQALADGQIFVVALDRFYHYDSRGDLFSKPEKPGAQQPPARGAPAAPRRR